MGNQLVSLPREIGRLRLLTRLDVCANPLASVPAELGDLQALKRLVVRSLPGFARFSLTSTHSCRCRRCRGSRLSWTACQAGR